MNVPRESFIPGHLNYHGMLGYGDETHDFGHITLFWDDLTLWHRAITTLFEVTSEMASVSMQLEQETDLVHMRLSVHDSAKDQWKIIERGFPDVTEMGRIDTIEVFGLQPHTVYKLEVFKDVYSEQA